MIPVEAVEAAQEAVKDAMIEHGPDGHIDGYEEITRSALEAAAPHMLADVSVILDRILGLHVPVMKDGEPVGCLMCDWEHPIFNFRTKWPCPTVFAITGTNRASAFGEADRG